MPKASMPKASMPEYKIWWGMRNRCYNPNVINYATYGGRGIKVCERWQEFEKFFEDVGERPSPEHSLDRVDNDKDYDPGNCRWATQKEQCNNKRNNVLLTFEGRTQTSAQWAAELGFRRNTLCHRLSSGWTVERALTTPATHKNAAKGRTWNGKTQSYPEWDLEYGLPPDTVRSRIRRGWTFEEALTTPINPNYQHLKAQ